MNRRIPAIAFFLIAAAATSAFSQTTSFTFQGNLADGGQPATGTYDFEFRLFDQLTNGTQLGPVASANGVPVAEGSFSVTLDFGDEFPGAERWVEIRVRQGVAPSAGENLGGFTILTPRQKIISAPYSVRSSSAANADSAATADFATSAGSASSADSATTAATATNALQLGGVAAAQYVVTSDPRLSDARPPTGGSPDYIQNRTTQQAASNFNISGSARAATFDAATEYRLGGFRFLGSNHFSNLFAGRSAGTDITTGTFNTLVGSSAGANTTEGGSNTMVGASAGFFNTTGIWNTFVGEGAGANNTTASGNTYVGTAAGAENQTGGNNTLVGAFSDVASGNLMFATAIGAGAVVASSNTVQLGRAGGQDSVLIPGNLTVTGTYTGQLPSGSGNYIQNSTTLQPTSNFNISGNGTVGGNLTAGRLIASPGTASLPGLRFTNATGNGIWSPDASTLAVSMGGLTAMRFRNSTVLVGPQDPFPSGGRLQVATEGSEPAIRILRDGQNVIATGIFADVVSGPGIGQGGVFEGGQQGISGTGKGGASSDTVTGVTGSATGTAGERRGVYGVVFDNDPGVEWSYGVLGRAISKSGTKYGVFGEATGAGNVNIGVFGTASGGTTNWAGYFGGRVNVTESLLAGTSVGIGTATPNESLQIAANGGSLVLGDPNCPAGATAIGFLADPAGSFDSCVNYSVRGNGTDLFLNRGTGGHIYIREANGSSQIIIYSGGEVELRQLASAGSTALCRNGALRISTCSSSIRYKNNIEDFTSGSDILRRLRPVTFAWKDTGTLDLGLVAEEVAEIEPLLATYNENGVVEGVKYDRIGVLLVNVVKEQQAMIESLRDEVNSEKEKGKKREAELQRVGSELAALKALVCASNRAAAICQ